MKLCFRFHPASAEELLKAFQVLDKDHSGYLTRDYISKILTEKGEPFSQEELNEMLAVASDTQTGLIMYELYINQIMVRNFIALIILLNRRKFKTFNFEYQK